MMKALNEKINNLYQSQNKNMGGKGLLWMALIFAVLSCYFFIPNIFSEGVIDAYHSHHYPTQLSESV